MKIYNEKQIQLAMRLSHSTNLTYLEIIESLEQIKLPTDEEIKKKMFRFNITDFGQMAAFHVGAKYVLEQIQGGNK